MSSSKPLSAQYISSTSPAPGKTFTQSLPDCPSEPTTEQRIAHITALRSGVSKLQAEINVFLTGRMDTQKAADAASAREAQEEENYGEEVIDG